MSKSKGNGVDPISVIAKFGADALRFALAYLTTENQDIRLSLDFECPHCGSAVEQTKKNRILPRIQCPKCKKDFRTQRAEKPEDKALPEGVMVGERFEVARNFCNKLWNAARFILNYWQESKTWDAEKPPKELPLEDYWIKRRFSMMMKEVSEAFESYRFADAVRKLYDFTWDDFCSFYIEMAKLRLQDKKLRVAALNSLTACFIPLLKLLHPVIPFITEELWQQFKEYAEDDPSWPQSIALDWWPYAPNHPDWDESKYTVGGMFGPEIDEQFAVFQELLRAVRDVRASRNVPPKMEIAFSVRCDEAMAKLLKPMEPYFLSMARARAMGWGPGIASPALSTIVPLTGMDVFVDISDLIDVPAEMAKLEKEIAKLAGFIQAKETKLASDFIQKAPAAVVEKERGSLEELRGQHQSATAALAQLKRSV
jgi:valyl-tRNA synthetase